MFEILSVILKKRKYIIIMMATSAVMAVASYYLTVITVYEKDIFIYAEMNGILYTVITLALGLIVAIFFGFYAAILAFMNDILSKNELVREKAGSLIGVTANIVASGCPSCGVPLLGLLGIPLGLTLLPFRGIELKILSVILLYISIRIISNNIRRSLVCSRKLSDAERT